MTGPKRIQLSRQRGWRMPEGAVKVDRSTRWGNFYVVAGGIDWGVAKRWGYGPDDFRNPQHVCASGDEAVRKFAAKVGGSLTTIGAIRAHLKGKDLACWCAPDAPCHADVLLRIANGGEG